MSRPGLALVRRGVPDEATHKAVTVQVEQSTCERLERTDPEMSLNQAADRACEDVCLGDIFPREGIL